MGPDVPLKTWLNLWIEEQLRQAESFVSKLNLGTVRQFVRNLRHVGKRNVVKWHIRDFAVRFLYIADDISDHIIVIRGMSEWKVEEFKRKLYIALDFAVFDVAPCVFDE